AVWSAFLWRLAAPPLKTQRVGEGVRLVARRDPFDHQLARRLVARAEDDAGQRHVADADQFQHRGDAVGPGARTQLRTQPGTPSRGEGSAEPRLLAALHRPGLDHAALGLLDQVQAPVPGAPDPHAL